MPKANQPVREIWPNPKQYQFLTSTTRHTAYGGARGGGKSWVAREQAVEDAGRYGRPNIWSQGIRICFIRRTLVDLLKNHLEPMKLVTAGLAKYNANDKCFYFRNGWEERIRAVAQPAFDVYIKRCPPKVGQKKGNPIELDCP